MDGIEEVSALPPGATPADDPAGASGDIPEVSQLPDGATPVEPGGDHDSIGQHLMTAGEGLGRGLTWGLSDLVAKPQWDLANKIHDAVPGFDPNWIASDPSEIKARKEENPRTSAGSELTGIVGGSILGAGAPGLISKAGAATSAASAAKFGKIGAAALQTMIEGGLFQAGDEISKAALGEGDQETPVASALAHIGGAMAMGFGLGGTFGIAGKALDKLGETKVVQGLSKILEDYGLKTQAAGERPAAAEVQQEMSQIKSLPGLKPEAPKIMDAADRLGLPVMNGMVSGDKAVQMGEDALINSPHTFAGAKRANLYSDAYNGAVNKLDEVIPDVKIEKADVGRQLQDSLHSKISEEAAPFNELYDEIRKVTPDVPIKERSAPAIARSIRELDGVKDAFKSPAAGLARDIAEEIESGGIKTVEQLRQYQTELGSRISPTASSSEKRIISIVKDKLDDWERRAIKQHVDGFISGVDANKSLQGADKEQIWGPQIERLKGLQSKIDEADQQYAPFRKKISDLASWLGKERVGGAKDATSFIKDRLEPEDLIQKLSSHRYAGLPEFMQKNFPEEYQLIRQYEKSQLRTASQRGQDFSHTQFFKKYENLPESFKNSIFTAPERQQIGDVGQYLKSFPKNFNPSGTDHMHAFRNFFSGITDATIGNARDLAIDKFVVGKDVAPMLRKAMGRDLTEPEAAAALKVMSSGNMTGLQQVLKHTSDAAKGLKKINKGVNALFIKGSGQAVDSEIDDYQREKLRKMVDSGALQNELHNMANPEQPRMPEDNDESFDPQKFAEGGVVQPAGPADPQPMSSPEATGMETHLPVQNMMMQAARGRIATYLNQQKPLPQMKRPFDQDLPDKQKARDYNKVLDLANNPLSILNKVQSGSLTTTELTHFKNLYPEIYNQLQKKMTSRMIEAQQKGERPPHKTRQAMSLFLGSNLDSSLDPKNILAAQQVYGGGGGQSQPGPQPMSKKTRSPSKAPLSKVAGSYQTPDQTNMARDQKLT